MLNGLTDFEFDSLVVVAPIALLVLITVVYDNAPLFGRWIARHVRAIWRRGQHNRQVIRLIRSEQQRAA